MSKTPLNQRREEKCVCARVRTSMNANKDPNINMCM